MIISASRRTDIPAFYSQWMVNRLREGYCQVPNPFNARQSARLWLAPQDVDAIVFWSRFPRPLLPFLPEIERMGHRFYFQYTLNNYPRLLEPHAPALSEALRAFCDLAQQIGPGRVIWRYDPILLSPLTPPEFHLENFQYLAQALYGSTRRCVISLYDPYTKIRLRMKKALQVDLSQPDPEREGQIPPLLRGIAAIAAGYGIQMTSCAEARELTSPGSPRDPSSVAPVGALSSPPPGALSGSLPDALPGALSGSLPDALPDNPPVIPPVITPVTPPGVPLGMPPAIAPAIAAGKCIDNDLLQREFGLSIPYLKDPGQRKACRCQVSKDIGVYNTCLFGCQYCYATTSFERARRNFRLHNPDSPTL